MTEVLAITYRPVVSAWLIATLVTLAASAMVWSLVRDRTRSRKTRLALALCRAIAIAGLAWILAGPSTVARQHVESTRPPLAVLVDASKSMAEPVTAPSAADENAGSDASRSRWQRLADHWLSDDTRARLREHARVRWRRFADTVQPMPGTRLKNHEPAGDRTRLFHALRQAAAAGDKNNANAPILLLSDGHDTQRSTAPRLLDRLKNKSRRVFTVPVGQRAADRSLTVQAWPSTGRVFEGDTVTITADLRHRGLSGRETTVTLRNQDTALRKRKTVRFDDRISRRVRFRVSPETEPGETTTTRLYTVTAKTKSAATSSEGGNNKRSKTGSRTRVFVTVSKERIRVLLLEGAPYWDSRAFARVLRAHPRIAITAIHRLGDERTIVMDQAEAWPSDGLPDASESLTRSALKRFDVVALGKRLDRFFDATSAARLVRFVREGGSLVLVRGRPVDPARGEAAAGIDDTLAPIMPVTWGSEVVRDLRLSLTPAGETSPLLTGPSTADTSETVFTELPAMRAATRVARARAASIVTMRQQAREGDAPMAALAHMRAGSGRVLAVLSDGLWQWSMRAEPAQATQPADDDPASPLAAFWSRAIHWLAAGGEFLPGQSLALTLEPRQPRAGEPVRVELESRYPLPANTSPRVTITRPNDGERAITLSRQPGRGNRFAATFRPASPGLFRVTLDPDSVPPGPDSPEADPTLPSQRLIVRPASIELTDTTPRPDVLRRIAEATGGRALALDDAGPLIEHLQGLSLARRPEPEREYSFAHWPVFALIAVSLLIEWAWRQRTGN